MDKSQFRQMPDREFQRMLEEALDQAPESDLGGQIDPFHNALNQILWGLALILVTLNLWNLNILLPGVGMILLVLGFRSLRRENLWFTGGHGAALGLLVWWLIRYFLNLTPYRDHPLISELLLWWSVMNQVLRFGILVCLRNAVRQVQKKAGLPPHGGNGILVWYVLSLGLGLIGDIGLGAWLWIGLYVLQINSLFRLNRELAQAGYAISPAPVRLSQNQVLTLYVLAVAVLTLTAYGCCSRYPMDWEPAPEVTVRQDLLDLGIPGEILADLTQEDLLRLAGAERVELDVQEFDMDTGREGDQLRLTGIGIQLSGGEGRWIILHHFQWLEDRDFPGTEVLRLSPEGMDDHRDRTGSYSGRVLYDTADGTYASAYYNFQEAYVELPEFWKPYLGHGSTFFFASFSFPQGAENPRGYVLYEITQGKDDTNIASYLDYVHQNSQLQFPVQTAIEFIQGFHASSDEVFQRAESWLDCGTK